MRVLTAVLLVLLVFVIGACGPNEEELTTYEEARVEKEESEGRLTTAEEENEELKAEQARLEAELAEAEAARDAAREEAEDEE